MKKKLALFLAAAMALSSLPGVAFAKSDNSVSNVTTVKADTDLDTTWLNNGDIPMLEILTHSDVPVTMGSKIRLTLKNSEWLLDSNDKLVLQSSDIGIAPNVVATGTNLTNVDVTYLSKTQIELTLGQSGGTADTDPESYASNPAPATVADADEDAITISVPGGGSGTITGLVSSTDDSAWVAEVSPASGNTTSGQTFTTTDAFNFTATDANWEEYTDSKPTTSFTATNDGEIYAYGMKITGANTYFNRRVVAESGTPDKVANITLTANAFGSKTDPDFYKELKGVTYTIAWTEGEWVWDTTATPAAGTLVENPKTAQITLYPNADGGAQTDATVGQQTITSKTLISIPMLTTVTDEGDATVAISSISGNVSTGTYTFATVGSGDTNTTVSDTITISEGKKTVIENIVIDEVSVGALDGEYQLKLKAPSNYELYGGNMLVTYAGGMGTGTNGSHNNTMNWSVTNGEGTNELTLTIAGSPTNALKSSGTKGSIIISGITIMPNDDAKFGDVNLTVSGKKMTKESIKIGTYKDYVVTMVAEDKELPVILAGDHPGYDDNSTAVDENEIETLYVLIEESVSGSWWGTKTTKLSVPDGVEIRGAEIKGTSGGSWSSAYVDDLSSSPPADVNVIKLDELGSSKYQGGTATVKEDRIDFKGIVMNTANDKLASVYVKLYVSVEPGFTGDIDVTLSGGGLDEDLTATVATAINPVSVSMKQSDIRIGYKNVAVNDITITENAASAIKKEHYRRGTGTSSATSKSDAVLTLQIEDNDYLKFDSIGSYSITEGDIVLNNVKVKSGTIQIDVKSESEKPSTIVLKGVTMNVDRTPAEGFYPLNVGGSAIVNNYSELYYDDAGYFDTEWFELDKAFKVITAAPGSSSDFITYVQMTIDSKTMVVGAETVAMDAAPYIKDGRTMLPVRYVANAFGVDNDQIYYDANTKTITIITSASRTVQLTVGSTTIYSNGTPINMDVAAEVVDGRTFIPVTWVATALGIATPVWDASARTVTFNGDYAPSASTTTTSTTVSTDETTSSEEE